jgi:pSer/pThr/pTyr-binding forkhead associated (FHA) protein
MPFALQVIKNDVPDEIIPIPAEGLTIGRSSGHLIFEDIEVSGLHCSLKFLSGSLVITDHGSRNGTYVNGSRVEKTRLAPSDVVGVGGHRFRVVEWPEAARLLDPDALVDEWLRSLSAAQKDASVHNVVELIDREIALCLQDVQILIRVFSHEGGTDVFTLPEAEIVLGRASAIPMLTRDEELSRKHARLYVNPLGRLMIEDCDSANGTFVNEEQVHGSRVILINDTIRIGRTKLNASLVIPEFRSAL